MRPSVTISVTITDGGEGDTVATLKCPFCQDTITQEVSEGIDPMEGVTMLWNTFQGHHGYAGSMTDCTRRRGDKTHPRY